MTNKFDEFNTPLGRFQKAKQEQRKVLEVDDVDDEEYHPPTRIPPQQAERFEAESFPQESEYPTVPTHQQLYGTPPPRQQRPAAVKPPGSFASPGDQFEDRQQLQQMKKKEVKPVDPETRDALTVLLGLGRTEVEVEVDDVTFTIRTLSSQKLLDISSKSLEVNTNMTMEMQNLHVYLTERSETLAASITKINGMDWRYVLKTQDPSVKVQLISEMDAAIVAHLYSEYNKMVKKHNTRFDFTDGGIEEAVEEIKK